MAARIDTPSIPTTHVRSEDPMKGPALPPTRDTLTRSEEPGPGGSCLLSFFSAVGRCFDCFLEWVTWIFCCCSSSSDEEVVRDSALKLANEEKGDVILKRMPRLTDEQKIASYIQLLRLDVDLEPAKEHLPDAARAIADGEGERRQIVIDLQALIERRP